MIRFEDVPYGYEYCFAGANNCPKAATCLRAIAAKLLSEAEQPQPATLHAVNPFYVERLSDFSACACYRSNELLRYARGMTTLLDEVPLKQAATIRLRVMECFSCERYYYHSRKGERLITPEEQERIAGVFKDAGLNITPRFDGYEYGLAW